MPNKEKHHDHESAVDEQIDRSIRDLRKELTALRGQSDTASVEKVQELRFQIKHLEAARSLPKRQRENTSPEASVQANRSLDKSILEGAGRRYGPGRPKFPRVPKVDPDGEPHLPETVGGVWELERLKKRK